MHRDILEYFEDGVTYHAFSDDSGLAIYSKLSNEVFVAAIDIKTLETVLTDKKSHIPYANKSVKEELCKKGFVKKEWH